MDVNFSQTGQSLALESLTSRQDLKTSREGNTDPAVKNEQQQSETEVLKAEEAKAKAQSADKESSVESAIEEIRDFVQTQRRDLNFSYDEGSRRSVIKVTDAESGDVIRQIPSEEVLKLAERIRNLQSEVGAAVGVLFNKSV
ncbi:flagellar protein FlaG [Bowmanella dokdonensis]|uniref:Flagellar protein FlaG n=1 Tax=Bowmanella dokdonensis TaxID=751969 RepID=A0A939DQH9_9ALTE|nr:flagellar protein FlaG [Bowmanella dokdonensis]MBN7826360.1 flagellar protein FlaG [Bowmanella dokdonensis]